jgi:hypothetical protein
MMECERLGLRQYRTGHGRAGQGMTGYARTGQGRAGHDRI